MNLIGRMQKAPMAEAMEPLLAALQQEAAERKAQGVDDSLQKENSVEGSFEHSLGQSVHQVKDESLVQSTVQEVLQKISTPVSQQHLQ